MSITFPRCIMAYTSWGDRHEKIYIRWNNLLCVGNNVNAEESMSQVYHILIQNIQCNILLEQK